MILPRTGQHRPRPSVGTVVSHTTPLQERQASRRWQGNDGHMSYYFAIVGAKDNPLFEHEFGTFKAGGDGVARFRSEARHMNQFIVHSSLDVVEELQWTSGHMYVRRPVQSRLLGSTEHC